MSESPTRAAFTSVLMTPSSMVSPADFCVRVDVQAVASSSGALQPTSRPLLGARSLAVPRYSQMVHRGEYPQYGGGGEAWCSPTSLSMILGYYKALPSKASYAWVIPLLEAALRSGDAPTAINAIPARVNAPA